MKSDTNGLLDVDSHSEHSILRKRTTHTPPVVDALLVQAQMASVLLLLTREEYISFRAARSKNKTPTTTMNHCKCKQSERLPKDG